MSCLGCSSSSSNLVAGGSSISSTRNLGAARISRTAITAAPQRDLRVMSFNVRVKTFLDLFGRSWDNRKELLVTTIKQFDPDVLGTQECLADQADYIRENLSGYSFVGAGRDDGKRGGEMCGVFYKTALFDKIDSGHFWLSNRPDKPGSKGWDAGFPRMVTWVKLKPRDGSQSFCIFNTHFDVFGSRARVESAKMLQQRMTTIAAGMPSIVTGDFNDEPGSKAYRTLMAGGNPLSDTFYTLHASAKRDIQGTRHDYSGDTDGPRIDWIMTTSGFTTVDSSIGHTRQGSKYPSDHFPVMAVLRPTVTPASPGLARIE
jgi:endonuclease/exonuclease/phosphatase family metal-dependent hydrolase